ncbi:MAG: putative acyltransferase [Deltaproteobacteria bacterium]|nr:putative acyltransferase [Deltaproteobacteria bacterium]
MKSHLQKKIENIQGLRGIAILLVILVHLKELDKKFGHGERILSDFFLIGASGVDLFFVISGFVLVAATREVFQHPASILHFFYNRLSRIYPLYWFYCAMILAVFLVRPEWVPALHEGRTSIMESLLLLPQDVFPFLPVAWALVHVIYFYCVFTIFMVASEKRLTGLLMLWALLVIIGNLLYQYGPFSHSTPIIKLITSPLTIEFIVGCVIAKLIQRGMKSLGSTIMIVGAALLLTGYGLYYALAPGTAPRDWLRMAIFGVPCILMVYGAVTMELSSNIVFPRWVRFLGDASYSIFLSHAIVLLPIGRLWGMFPIPGKMDNIFVMIIMTGLALLVGIGSYLIIERRISSFLKRAGTMLFRLPQPSPPRAAT